MTRSAHRVEGKTGRLDAMLNGLGRRTQLIMGVAAARSVYAAAAGINPANHIARRRLGKLRSRRPGERTGLRFVALGTTGICNASCLHCPTGKASTAHVPRVTMDMDIFRHVVDTIVEQGWSVLCMSFGLFGDGLVDPLVVERARYARERLPDVMLDINSNGAAFNPGKHAALASHVSLLTLHCESLRAANYDRLMAPLRLKNVFPKYRQILDCFPGKVRVSVPVTRVNLDELTLIRDHFLQQGAAEVVFDPISSRCAEDMTLFHELAIGPKDIRCTTEIMDDLIIDCDGTIVACCQDFARRMPTGDVKRAGLLAALDDPRRKNFRQMLADGRHETAPTCRNCEADCRTPNFPFDYPGVSA